MSNRASKRAALFCSAFLALSAGPATAQNYETYVTVTRPPADYNTYNWRLFYETRNEWTRLTQLEYPNKLDIAYGADPKQKVDVYFPKGEVKNAPVMIFFHGGGFVEGDKAHYGYIAREYAEQGVITVVASYRLQGFFFPGHHEDAQATVGWVYRNIASMGGNPNHLVVSGHSAGATLAVELGADRSWMARQGVPKEALIAAIPVAGTMLAAPVGGATSAPAPRPVENPAPGDTTGRPGTRIQDPAYILLAVGTWEPHMPSNETFAAVLKERGIASELIILPGHGHQETADAVGDRHSPVFKAAMRFLRAG